MAHFKVVVGALLACAISAQAFPADSPASSGGFGVGSTSYQPVRPINSFGSTSAPLPQHGSYPNGQIGDVDPDEHTFKAASAVNRFVRDDSHEQAHGRPTTESFSSSSSTSAPHRRDATTVSYTTNKRPLNAQYPAANTQTTHTAASRRDESSVLGASTHRPVQLPASLASSISGSSTASPKNRRDSVQASTTVRTFSAAATVPASGINRPTYSPLNKRDQGSQVPTARPSGLNKPLFPASTVAPKNKRDEVKAAGTTSKPASTSSGVSIKPLAASSTTAASKNKRDSSSTAAPLRPVAFGSTVQPTTVQQSFLSISSKTKRQAGSSDDEDSNDNRQLLNRPTLIPRPNRPTRPSIFPWRNTTPNPNLNVQSASAVASVVSTSAPVKVPAFPTTVSASKFKRDQYPTTEDYKPFNVETFSGSQNQPGQTTHFTGSTLTGNRPSGGFASSSIAGTTFSTNPHLNNKRQTEGGDSSSGEESQED